MKNEPLRYLMNVSKQERKMDNVCYSGLVWEGIGSILPVPESIAVRLLKFPDAWKEVGREAPNEEVPHDLKAAIVAAIKALDPNNPEHFSFLPNSTAVEKVLGRAIPVSVLEQVWREIADEWKEPKRTEPEDGHPVSPEEQLLVNIMGAIASFDPLSPEHFTNDGVPRVEAIEKAMGVQITARQRDAAWMRMQKQKD